MFRSFMIILLKKLECDGKLVKNLIEINFYIDIYILNLYIGFNFTVVFI